MSGHICMVCFRPSSEHDEDAGWPPKCCYGCLCGEARPEARAEDLAKPSKPVRAGFNRSINALDSKDTIC